MGEFVRGSFGPASFGPESFGPESFGPESFGMGCATLGNHLRAFTDEQCQALIQAAWDGGVRTFDTAPHYGLGLSERRLGAALANLPRDEVVVSTKVGRLLVPQQANGRLDDEDFLVPADVRRQPDYSVAGVRASLESSLERLGLETVDIAYVHDAERYDLEGGLTTALEGLQQLKQQGLVGAIGFASMSREALRRAAAIDDWDELMVAGAHTLASDATPILDRAEANGIRVTAAAVFNGGVLATGLGDSQHSTETGTVDMFDYAPITVAMRARISHLEQLCAEHGVELADAALQYPLRHPAVVRVVAGGVTPAQVLGNLERLSALIPEEFWQAVGS